METKSASTPEKQVEQAHNDPENYEPDVYFEPVIKLPLVEKITLEEDENQLLRLRAKLYRFDSTESPSTWKERGTGEIKLLYHHKNNTVRIVMRREKTLKICANHFITPSMTLQRPNNNRKNWWMWSTGSDFADEVSKAEIFAIKFANEENAESWKEMFKEAQRKIQNESSENKGAPRVQNADSENSSESEEESSNSDGEEDPVNKSTVANTTEGLSESVLKLDLSK